MNDAAASALLECLICIKTFDVVVISALASELTIYFFEKQFQIQFPSFIELYVALLNDGLRLKVSANFVASKMLPSFSPILTIDNLKESQVMRLTSSGNVQVV